MYGDGRNYYGGGGAYNHGENGGGGRGRGGGRGGGGGAEGQWQRNVVCKYYLQNRCSRGDSCWFIHGGAPSSTADEILPSMSALSLGGPSRHYPSAATGASSSWRSVPREPEVITGPNIVNTLPDKVLALIFEHLGDNYIQLARLALVCRKWRSISEDDEQCEAWKHAAQNYYLCQNGSMRKALGTWKAFFGLMVNFEDNMMGDAFDNYQNDQDWGELLDDYESEAGWYGEGASSGHYQPDMSGSSGEYYYGPPH